MAPPVRVEDNTDADIEAGVEAMSLEEDDAKSGQKRDRIARGHRSVQGVHAKIAAVTAKLQQHATDLARPWHVVRAVEEAWGAGDRALTQVQDLLRTTATALADVTSVPADAAAKQLGADAAKMATEAKTTALNCLQVLYYVDHMLRVSSTVLRLCLESRKPSVSNKVAEVSDDDISAGMARFSNMEGEDSLTKYQSLVIFLLNQAYLRGYRRYGADFYARVLTPEGRDTRAWKKACAIRDFVYDVTRKEINFAQWCNLTANVSNVNYATEFLTSCRDMQLPELKKDRDMFAFRNGVYVASADKFVPHAGPCARPDVSNDDGQPGDVAACKFFDLDFPAGLESGTSTSGIDDWYGGIATPHLQSILDHQKFAPDVCRWFYVFVGRLLYEVGAKDAWQVIPFFKGQAGTGKSTLLMRVCAAFYEPEDVGVLSNNIERKFGLSAICDKLLFVAPEIKGDLQMEQAEFQSVVSGEACQINIKYKKAETLPRWSVPGVLAGNEAPNWVDNAGSVSRRMVLFDFCHRVDNADMELGKKLTEEMPLILLKCNRAYLEAVRRHSKDSIWKHLPKYFLQTKQDLVESVNSLESFLASGTVVTDGDAYMPLEDFVGLYHIHCDLRSLPRMKVNKDFKDRLSNHRIFVDKKSRFVYPRDGLGMMTGGVEWLLGVDVRRAFSAADAGAATDCGGDF